MKSYELRQMLVLAGLMLSNISDGFVIGQMSGMLATLRAEGSPIPITDADLSWIASVLNLTSICGYIVLGVVCEVFGRKLSLILLSLPILITWIILYFLQSKTILLVTRIIIGIFYGGVMILSYINIGEYIPPKSRTFYINLICGVGPLTGIMLGHIFSTILNWRHVALIGIVPTTFSIILTLFWEESPAWLASKGMFEKCEIAFIKLRGYDDESNNELWMLLAHEKKKQSKYLKHNQHTVWSKIVLAFRKISFWRVMVLGLVNMIYRIASGRVLFNTFAITLLQDITGQSNIFLFTFIVDSFTVVGALLSCFLVKKFQLRPIILICGAIANMHLVFLSICIYTLPTDNYYYSCLKVFILASYFIILSAGPYAALESLISETFPLEIKTFCLFLLGVFASPSQFLAIKMAPSMFMSIGYEGVFLLNASLVAVCLLYLWAFMPETKGRTLQEIEEFFRNGRFETPKDKQEELLKSSYTES